MKSKVVLLCVAALALGFSAQNAYAVKPVTVETICNDGLDNDNDGLVDCADSDCSADPACAAPPPTGSHSNLTWADYPTACLGCHQDKYNEMHGSTHYQWLGQAPDMVNGVGQLQGKLTNAVNSYCINILGDWKVCGKCHVGRGLRPDDPQAGLSNIDCLMCHNEEYARLRTRLADGSMGVAAPTDTMVQNIAKPTRANCLVCHANAGGGDAVKRGDLAMANITNSDPHYDVHMNTAGANLTCQSCHSFQNHRVIGKGSDLRPTDDLARGAELQCTNCHVGMDSGSGHAAAGATRTDADRHVARVACQSCHIPTYGKVATEMHRDWRFKHDGTDASTCNDTNPCPGHPHTDKLANVIPELLWWNRLSDNALLGDDASRTYDAAKGTYPTSRPLGNINDGKLYPFKYKTADQPMITADNKLLPLDTLVYLAGNGSVDTAIASGLANMGYPTSEPYTWVTTDTYQMLNHGVTPSAEVDCAQCHQAPFDVTVDNKLDKLGYKLKGPKSQVCSQCHAEKNLPRDWERMHGHISKTAGGAAGIDCYFCHDFRRPERGLCDPCDPVCSSNYVDTNPYPHVCGP